MVIHVYKLGWNNKCCGCFNNIPGDEKTFVLAVGGIKGTIHLCEKCIDEISNAKEKELEKTF